MSEAILDRTSDQAVGFLRVFHVQAKESGVVRWKHDVVAENEIAAERIALEFILTDPAISDLAKSNLVFSSERARDLHEPYGWVVGVR